MAHQSSDGKKFTNKPPMMAHERSLGRMAQHSEAGGAEPTELPGGDENDGAQIAEEHGPAQEVHMMHDHEGGQHQVMSMHPDGHQHHSMHGSAAKAHEHGKKLAGAHMEEQPDGDEPEYE